MDRKSKQILQRFWVDPPWLGNSLKILLVIFGRIFVIIVLPSSRYQFIAQYKVEIQLFFLVPADPPPPSTLTLGVVVTKTGRGWRVGSSTGAKFVVI